MNKFFAAGIVLGVGGAAQLYLALSYIRKGRAYLPTGMVNIRSTSTPSIPRREIAITKKDTPFLFWGIVIGTLGAGALLFGLGSWAACRGLAD